jgi:hypothetical protein
MAARLPQVVVFFRSVATGPDKINAAGERGAERSLLFRVFVVRLGGDNVGTRQPAVQIDIPAALGAKWF